MFTVAQHERISRKCYNALTKAVESLPELLSQSDPDRAAAIVADLIKAFLASPIAETDPGAALAEVVRCCKEHLEDEKSSASANTPTFEPSGFADSAGPVDSATFEQPDLPPKYEAQILGSPSKTWDQY